MTQRLAPILLVAALSGCSGGPAGDGPPPAGLAMPTGPQIAESRAVRDQSLRTDPDSPVPPEKRPGFRALEYYAFDPAWQFAVRLRRYPGGLPFTLVTTSGRERPALKVGYVEFPRDGANRRLQVYQLQDGPKDAAPELFLPFLDGTSGTETYGAGRYLDLAPGPDGWYVLDFNLAYHPLCAYGRTDYVCPRTPEENRLPFAVTAGERGWAGH
jgi:uncharacterized protein (DUF1684 family)